MKWKLRWPNPLLFKWEEPEAFRVAEDKRSAVASRPWMRPLAVCGIVAVMLVCWVISLFNPVAHPIDIRALLATGIFLGLLLFYIAPWWQRRAPSPVGLYAYGMMRMGAQSFLSYKYLVAFTWTSEPTYYVLHIVTRNGRHLSFGVPDLQAKAEIESILGMKLINHPPLVTTQ